MNRVQMACYSLLASAFILAALVFVQASRLADNRAHAEMTITKGTVTMLSTQSWQADTELVYVLDSRSGVLMCYTLEPNRKIIELLPGGALHVPTAFDLMVAQQPAGQGPAPVRRSR